MRKRTNFKDMDNGILYVGIDLHERKSQLAVFDQAGALLDEKRLPTKELRSHLSSLPGEKRVAMESRPLVPGGDGQDLTVEPLDERLDEPQLVQLMSISRSRRFLSVPLPTALNGLVTSIPLLFRSHLMVAVSCPFWVPYRTLSLISSLSSLVSSSGI